MPSWLTNALTFAGVWQIFERKGQRSFSSYTSGEFRLGWFAKLFLLGLFIWAFFALGQNIIWAARSVYLDNFTSSQSLPRDIKSIMTNGVELGHVSVNRNCNTCTRSTVSVSATNTTDYDLQYGAIRCTIVSEVGETTGWLEIRNIKSGQTKSTRGEIEYPGGIQARAVCVIRDARTPYGWWTGIPRGVLTKVRNP